jgi:hypothetical protein
MSIASAIIEVVNNTATYYHEDDIVVELDSDEYNAAYAEATHASAIERRLDATWGETHRIPMPGDPLRVLTAFGCVVLKPRSNLST